MCVLQQSKFTQTLIIMSYTGFCQVFSNFFRERISLAKTPVLLHIGSIKNASNRLVSLESDCRLCDIKLIDYIGRIFADLLAFTKFWIRRARLYVFAILTVEGHKYIYFVCKLLCLTCFWTIGKGTPRSTV